MHKAGFDGVEIHAANEYLPERLLQTNTSMQSDEYRGPEVRNCVHFVLGIISAVIAALGTDRVCIRLSPRSTFQGGCLCVCWG